MYLYKYVCTYIYICICICIIYVCIYMYIYVYIYIQILWMCIYIYIYQTKTMGFGTQMIYLLGWFALAPFRKPPIVSSSFYGLQPTIILSHKTYQTTIRALNPVSSQKENAIKTIKNDAPSYTMSTTKKSGPQSVAGPPSIWAKSPTSACPGWSGWQLTNKFRANSRVSWHFTGISWDVS